jgi:malonyl-CoA/methylmalonyl-CoA synthetase
VRREPRGTSGSRRLKTTGGRGAVVRRQSPHCAAATETGIVNALKGALANFKVSKRVHFIDELPRNSMGKAQKKVLRDQYA